jgi:F1-F0 ATPase (N-ATPase) AtpR subunit
MTMRDALASVLAVSACAAGFAVGLAYFAALKRTVKLFGSGGGRLMAAALIIGRLAGMAVFLGLAAMLGAVPLLSAFLGFLAARAVAVRAVRRAS